MAKAELMIAQIVAELRSKRRMVELHHQVGAQEFERAAADGDWLESMVRSRMANALAEHIAGSCEFERLDWGDRIEYVLRLVSMPEKEFLDVTLRMFMAGLSAGLRDRRPSSGGVG